MKTLTFFRFAFAEDPHLRNGERLYFDPNGKPINTDACDLLSRAIVRRLFLVVDGAGDNPSMKEAALKELFHSRTSILLVAAALSQRIPELAEGKEVDVDDVLNTVDLSYQMVDTGAYHAEGGVLLYFGEAGDPIAKWIVYQVATGFTRTDTPEAKISAIAAIIQTLCAGAERLHGIGNTIVGL